MCVLFCRLTVHLQSYPPPRFTWFCKGQAVKPSQRFKVTYDQGIITLVIFNVQVQDSGDYVLKATNELGEVTCKTLLNVKRKLTMVSK